MYETFAIIFILYLVNSPSEKQIITLKTIRPISIKKSPYFHVLNKDFYRREYLFTLHVELINTGYKFEVSWRIENFCHAATNFIRIGDIFQQSIRYILSIANTGETNIR